ncbi:unnamed protein product [Diamesa hyperborea]
MNIFIGLMLVISVVTLIQADPTQEELDSHFIYLGNHVIQMNSQGTGRSEESKKEHKWYLSLTDKLDWSEAVAACKTFDMNLAEMKSESAMNIFKGYITNFHWVHHYYFRAYVGITKPSNSQTWYRAFDSKKVDTKLDLIVNPNDFFIKRCLFTDVSGYQQENVFGSAACSEKNFYICEKYTSSMSGIA